MKTERPFYYIAHGAKTKLYTLRIRFVEFDHKLEPKVRDHYIKNLANDWGRAVEKATAHAISHGGSFNFGKSFSLYDITRRNEEQMRKARKIEAQKNNSVSELNDWLTMRSRAWGVNHFRRYSNEHAVPNIPKPVRKPLTDEFRNWILDEENTERQSVFADYLEKGYTQSLNHAAEYRGIWYFNFGKHEGKHLREVLEIDRPYCEWLCNWEGEKGIYSVAEKISKQELTVQLVRTLLEKNPKPKFDSQHQGEVDKMINFSGRVESMRTVGFDSPYGTCQLIKIRDEAGNLYVTFYRGGNEPDEFDNVSVRAKVRDHSEYDGEKQTVVTRCRFTFEEVKS